ncbi:MAG: AmmeMemoRadiSam system radical SAM enzyme [Candidatus Krumholzibacteria bacterium]|nr:AmmeMemoRadiSam system radical SAM enzyme [Candidatus Krumholzibacteria bacterium]
MEALFYEKLPKNRVRCLLCPNLCVIEAGGKGRCRLRVNDGGVLQARSYGMTVTAAVDPIEKKPLYHFMPGSEILSIGPNGCTLTCEHCQNWNISQEDCPVTYIPPEELAAVARSRGSVGVAFTYTEPLLWYEYLIDVLPLLRDDGLKSVLVTNGYLNDEPAERIVPMVDGFNIDMKSFNDDFYRKYCGGSLEPVKRFIEIAADLAHVEVTTLLIPGLNDSPSEIEALARWLGGISKDIPLHLSRFFPRYRMKDIPPTPSSTLKDSWETARRFLDYVYIGNIFIEGTENTLCPGCGENLIMRSGYSTTAAIKGDSCPSCGKRIKGVWK